MKNLVRFLPLLLLLGITATLLAGCGGGGHTHYYEDYYITIVNDSPWSIVVEPWGVFLVPGDSWDVDVGYDVVRVIVVRDFDGLVLADVDMARGDVLVVHE